MPTKQLQQVSQAQQERLAYIEFRLLFLGCVNRCDLAQRFGLTEAAATRDLALYKQLAGANISYDTIARTYRIGAKPKPLFSYKPEQVLTALAEGFGDDFVAPAATWLRTEMPSRLNAPSVEVLIPVSRALYNGQALSIAYGSLSSGFSQRRVTPLALVDNGLRWHLRAYDHKRERYADFVLNRITKAKLNKGKCIASELRAQDHEWQQQVELQLVPHPSLAHPDVIAFEYGMTDGVMRLSVRASLAGYLLRRWSVDCTTNHRLQGPEYQLWLQNADALRTTAKDDLTNLTLAPGFLTAGAGLTEQSGLNETPRGFA